MTSFKTNELPFESPFEMITLEKLISNDMIKANNFENVFKVLMAIVFGAMTAGQSGAMAPDFGDACAAAHRVIKEGCPTRVS